MADIEHRRIDVRFVPATDVKDNVARRTFICLIGADEALLKLMGSPQSVDWLHSHVKRLWVCIDHNIARCTLPMHRKAIGPKGNSTIAQSASQSHSKWRNGVQRRQSNVLRMMQRGPGQRPVSEIEPIASVRLCIANR